MTLKTTDSTSEGLKGRVLNQLSKGRDVCVRFWTSIQPSIERFFTWLDSPAPKFFRAIRLYLLSCVIFLGVIWVSSILMLYGIDLDTAPIDVIQFIVFSHQIVVGVQFYFLLQVVVYTVLLAIGHTAVLVRSTYRTFRPYSSKKRGDIDG